LTNLSTVGSFGFMNFGFFIRQQREGKGLSLRETARQVEVDASYLSRVEAGKAPPSEQLVNKLAKTLEYDKDELFLLSGRLPDSLHEILFSEPERAKAAIKSIAVLPTVDSTVSLPTLATSGMRAIEDTFPFEYLSIVAEAESWRKEIHRPIYHIHKWWAQRLGSIFRALIIGAAAPIGSSVMELFYQPVRLPGLVVFDPFMGSGTTVGEAHKLGCTAIGKDINPVAYRAVKSALGPVNQQEVADLFHKLDSTVGKEIRSLYRSKDEKGQSCNVLYYFWVKVLSCPSCDSPVDLFPRYIFAKHAYVKKNPGVHILCPGCGSVFSGDYRDKKTQCPECKKEFNPHEGTTKRITAICQKCSHEFPIAKTAKLHGKPPSHRMYAKLVLTTQGKKRYLRVTKDDIAAYDESSRKLKKLSLPLPNVPISNGHNTKQILNYGYRHWHELFNDRQLLALSLLAKGIQDLPSSPAREMLTMLFSGALEFNNMFASYKGEGTGAVRHMFSHHILKPERMPIEANVWGTSKSSGAFMTLYKSRIRHALDYRAAPYEIKVGDKNKKNSNGKVFGLSPPMGGEIGETFSKEVLGSGAIYLSCGDSSRTDLPDKSVDLVVTDPPFFDNVHYSELADFFFAWQETFFGNVGEKKDVTTRNPAEVQDVDPEKFGIKLGRVFTECFRVLKDGGLLIFSYHHSREDGWSSVARAVLEAGFTFIQSQPVKSEMSVAAPKAQAKEPIDIDVLLVCRKREEDHRKKFEPDAAYHSAEEEARAKVARFNNVGRKLSRNDVRVVLLSQLLVELSARRSADKVDKEFKKMLPLCRETVEAIWYEQTSQQVADLAKSF